MFCENRSDVSKLILRLSYPDGLESPGRENHEPGVVPVLDCAIGLYTSVPPESDVPMESLPGVQPSFTGRRFERVLSRYLEPADVSNYTFLIITKLSSRECNESFLESEFLLGQQILHENAGTSIAIGITVNSSLTLEQYDMRGRGLVTTAHDGVPGTRVSHQVSFKDANL